MGRQGADDAAEGTPGGAHRDHGRECAAHRGDGARGALRGIAEAPQPCPGIVPCSATRWATSSFVGGYSVSVLLCPAVIRKEKRGKKPWPTFARRRSSPSAHSASR